MKVVRSFWNSEKIVHLRLKLFTFSLYGSNALFFPFLPIYLQSRGFAPAEIGWLLTVGPVAAILSNPFWGFVSDRLQNVKLVVLFLVSGSLLAGQFLFRVEPFWAVFAAMAVFFFFNTSLFPINTTQVFQAIEGTDRRFGSFRMWGSIGYAAVVLASGPVIEAIGIGELVWVYGGWLATGLAFGLLLYRAPAVKGGRLKPVITFRATMRSLLHIRFMLFLSSTLLVFIPVSVTSLYLSLFILDLGGSPSSVGWAMFAASVLEVPLFLLLDRMSKPSERSMLNLLLLSTALFAVRWLMMSVVESPSHIVLLQCMSVLTLGFYMYTAAQLVEMLTEKTYRASGQTIYALVQSAVAMVIAGSAGGYLYETIGPHKLYLLCAALAMLGFAGMLALRLSAGERR